MLIRNLSELPARLKKGQTVIGIDYGSKIIGIAISDPGLTVASPVAALIRRSFAEDAAFLVNLVGERNAGAFIVGLPRGLDGKDSKMAQAARAFIRTLFERGGLPDPDMPVAFWDERFSTAAVQRFMLEDDMSRQRRAATVDKAAAAYILQGALDAMRQKN